MQDNGGNPSGVSFMNRFGRMAVSPETVILGISDAAC
jgi:hypothetical protein